MSARRASRFLLAASLLASLLILPSARGDQLPPAPADLNALLSGFQNVEAVHARFREEKRVAMLAAPLLSEGEIYFSSPDLLLRRVTSPTPSAALIQARRLTLVQGSQREEIDLAHSPVLAAFVSSFRDVLSGNRAALERNFHATYTTDAATWTLTLRPRDPALAHFMREMVLTGGDHSIHSMRMIEESGDVTTTHFHQVELRRAFSAQERARIFSI